MHIYVIPTLIISYKKYIIFYLLALWVVLIIILRKNMKKIILKYLKSNSKKLVLIQLSADFISLVQGLAVHPSPMAAERRLKGKLTNIKI